MGFFSYFFLESSLQAILVFGFVVLGAGYAAFKKLQSSPKILIRNSKALNSHRWDEIQEDSLSTCSRCSKPLEGWFRLQGVQCQICKISCHSFCSKKAQQCKLSWSAIYKDCFVHDWKNIYIPKDTKCAYCRSLCGSVYDSKSLQCCWCLESIHYKCLDLASKDCDMGACKKHAIHPGYISRLGVIQKLPPDAQPIVVVINPKSGGQIGETALKAFYSLLNPVQVINVFSDLKRLEYFYNISDLRILVAGGDGTVSKLLAALYDETWKGKIPYIGIFPLGTGNDLSFVYNWGKGLKSRKGKNLNSMRERAQEALKSIYKAYPSNLDRWVIRMSYNNNDIAHTMCNYFGMGVDAKIALDFHELREKKPYLFKSRVNII
jgi:diacylglycerol kinase (ATP)